MKITRSKKGIKLPVLEDGFYGYVYISMESARKAFPWIDDWQSLSEEGYDLGRRVDNRRLLLRYGLVYQRRTWASCSWREREELTVWKVKLFKKLVKDVANNLWKEERC